MTSIIDEAILEANEADVSVPIFISINPDGSLGLNYLGLAGNAVGTNPPRYWGVYNAVSFVHGQKIVNDPSGPLPGDLMTVIAAQTSIAPRVATTMWNFICVQTGFQSTPRYSWRYIGGTDLVQFDSTGNGHSQPGGGGIWVPMPGVNTITVPATSN